MRCIILTAVLLTVGLAGFAQTRVDYENAITKFQQFYNAKNDESINNMFADFWHNGNQSAWPKGSCSDLYKNYGKMLSFEYIFQYEHLAYFKTTFEKSTHMHSFSLDKDNKFGTHHFETSDTDIDSILISRQMVPIKVIKRPAQK